MLNVPLSCYKRLEIFKMKCFRNIILVWGVLYQGVLIISKLKCSAIALIVSLHKGSSCGTGRMKYIAFHLKVAGELKIDRAATSRWLMCDPLHNTSAWVIDRTPQMESRRWMPTHKIYILIISYNPDPTNTNRNPVGCICNGNPYPFSPLVALQPGYLSLSFMLLRRHVVLIVVLKSLW